ncbi:translation initiation factor IF-3 [Planctomycetota bacterium]|nr:translation initiation factor IF-3 [Planctomycetota bacterium]
MARRFKPQPKDTGKRLRVNDQIRISPIRLISEDNEQLGVVQVDDAKRRARDAGLDLVEVSPNSEPSVCRIMDYGKWKYAQKKKEQKAKSHAKQSELKGVRLRPKIDSHDLDIKLNKARGFLEEGNKVQFMMLFRGREVAHKDIGYGHMNSIVEKLSDIAKIESPPMLQGRRMGMVLAPDRSGKQKSAAKKEAPKKDAPAPKQPAKQ